ncbi:Inositol polyphosphate kinase [Dillenia turbinata]|uniref:Inositol polyphosphate multikinase n=1 Tax=Dillenia turbinata TaxID=194707 RepID=A0AAN8VNZ9_9MAGN
MQHLAFSEELYQSVAYAYVGRSSCGRRTCRHLWNFNGLQAMFKIPDHQVAGHQAHDGLLGPLIDDSGRFYKPLQNNERGSKEVAFYTSFSFNPRIPDHIRKFFPVFYGTQVLEASDGSGLHPHLVLEDLVSSCLSPCIMDIKIGSRTCKELGYWKPDRKVIQKFSTDEVRQVLRKFVSSNSSGKSVGPDCAFASMVYGGSSGILAQLLEFKAWFEDQTIFHLNSCSVLLVYEKELALKGEISGAKVKLIDFAHVVEGSGTIDHNFWSGLCSLIKFISEILTSPDEYEKKTPQDYEKNELPSDKVSTLLHYPIALPCHILMISSELTLLWYTGLNRCLMELVRLKHCYIHVLISDIGQLRRCCSYAEL